MNCPICKTYVYPKVSWLKNRDNLTCGKPECRKAQRAEKQRERRYNKLANEYRRRFPSRKIKTYAEYCASRSQSMFVYEAS